MYVYVYLDQVSAGPEGQTHLLAIESQYSEVMNSTCTQTHTHTDTHILTVPPSSNTEAYTVKEQSQV